MDTKEQFQEALDNDEYAEFELACGGILVTDWEGDGEIYPSVIPEKLEDDSHHAINLIREEVRGMFDFTVQCVEWDSNNKVYQIRVTND